MISDSSTYERCAHVAPYSVPNQHVAAQICSFQSNCDEVESRSELDSHANMIVFGKSCFVIHKTGRYADVNAFSPDIETLKKIPIVDAAVTYDCPYTMKTYLLVARNVLYIPSMDHNLIPPFILREAGIKVNETPKIHSENPSIDDHCLYFEEEKLRIPLSLMGIFSYFVTRKPVEDDLDNSELIYLTPDSPKWNPHSDIYARNEETFLDWEGNLIDRKYREKLLIEHEKESMVMAMDADHRSNLMKNSEMNDRIDTVYVNACTMNTLSIQPHNDDKIPFLENEVASHLSSLSSTLDSFTFASDLNERLAHSKYAMSVGSTNVSDENDELFISATHAEIPKGVSARDLSKVWMIDIETARRTLDVTTQLRRQDGYSKLSRNLNTNDRMLRYRRINTHFFTDTFFVTKKAKSTRGHTCMQLFVSDKGFVHVIPMKSKAEFPSAFRSFAKEIGVPHALIVDPAAEQTSKTVKKFCHEVGTTLRILEEHTQWANRAELYIGLFKEAIRKDMKASNSPLVLWDYCAERRSLIHNLTAKSSFQLDGSNPHTATLGEEGDISNLCTFSWYEWCYFREQSNDFPYPKDVLGKVLGPAKKHGNEMTQWILKENGRVVPRRTLVKLTPAQMNNVTEQNKRNNFDNTIKGLLGDSMNLPPSNIKAIKNDDDVTMDPALEYHEDEFENDNVEFHDEDPVDNAGKPICEQPFYDRLIHAEVCLPKGELNHRARVVGRAKDRHDKPIGTYNDNPYLNSIVYDVEFPDGMVKQYAANTIAENILNQVDSEGYMYNLLDAIIDHRTDGNAITRENMYVVTKRGRRRQRRSTIGWKLLVLWKDGTKQWIPLHIVKESNPVECAEYAMSRKLQHEPAFNWWVPYTLKKRDRIIASVNTRVRKATHKYGVEMPTSIEHAYQLDVKNGDTLWRDAINKEMYNVSVAFEILESERSPPPGWTKSSGHLVFDVKMDFTRKARWVKDGHRTADLNRSTYAGVVSRETVRIAMLYSAMNNVPIVAGDILNAYLQAPSSEKHYIICGTEFGLENVGKVALIRRALYGGKSAGRDFWNHLRDCMHFLGFTSCRADPDLWIRPTTKLDGTPCYDYVLLYVDDTLAISENAEHIIRNEIGKYFEMKEASIGKPTIYLGGKVNEVTLNNGANAWSFSSSQYVQAAVRNVNDYLEKRGEKLQPKVKAPFTSNYRPELETTPELDEIDSAYYALLIGILRWIVELGRINIAVETSLMSSYMAMPKEGH